MEKESIFIGIMLFIGCVTVFFFTFFMCKKRGKKDVLVFLLLSLFVPYLLGNFIYWGTDIMKIITIFIILIPLCFRVIFVSITGLNMYGNGCSTKEIDEMIDRHFVPLLICGSLFFFTLSLNFLLQKFPEYSLL